MDNPSAEQAVKIIDDLVNKTLNTQNAFERAIEKLLDESARIQGSVADPSLPLSSYETKQILLNVSYIIRELGMVEKGFGKPIPKELHQDMLHRVDPELMKQ